MNIENKSEEKYLIKQMKMTKEMQRENITNDYIIFTILKG
jgi:hypothetical protein